jgi:hypothetical protein
MDYTERYKFKCNHLDIDIAMNQLKQIHTKIFEDNKKITGIVGMVIIFTVIASVFSYEASGIETSDAEDVLNELRNNAGGGGGGPSGGEMVPSTGSESFSQYTSENSQHIQILTLEHSALIEVSASLSWNDEDPGGVGARTNEPDEFKITLTSPSGQSTESNMVSNSGSGNRAGTIPAITITVDEPETEVGDWEIIVQAGDCGDYYGRWGIFSYASDDGNDWTLTIDYKYYAFE